MAIIGNSDISGTGAVLNIAYGHTLNDVDVLVLGANQILTEAHFHSAGHSSGSASAEIKLGVYDISGGTASAPLLASVTIPFNATTSGLKSVTGLSIDLSAHSGKTVAIGHSKVTDAGRAKGYQNVADSSPFSSDQSYTLSDPFIENTKTGDSWQGMYVVVESAATGPVITGPSTAQEGVATSITGTDLATVTETTLQDSAGTYSVVQSTVLNGSNLDVTPRRSVIAPTPGNPQPGIPVTPDITSPSVTTPWANRWRVTDE